ncbi:hypothetical protein CAG71_09790 [Photobacterium halotolerans]|uniref:Uncharacterized protein n=1 Tax=Photobacterium halotolerans TaxID=265726 RepID=A0A7X4WE15_9GAMM|nr:hypothetical protein [Photobacterium halotolerans]NAW86743.1 hypothetical protein [Photobacterium halotolerans]
MLYQEGFRSTSVAEIAKYSVQGAYRCISAFRAKTLSH